MGGVDLTRSSSGYPSWRENVCVCCVLLLDIACNDEKREKKFQRQHSCFGMGWNGGWRVDGSYAREGRVDSAKSLLMYTILNSVDSKDFLNQIRVHSGAASEAIEAMIIKCAKRAREFSSY